MSQRFAKSASGNVRYRLKGLRKGQLHCNAVSAVQGFDHLQAWVCSCGESGAFLVRWYLMPACNSGYPRYSCHVLCLVQSWVAPVSHALDTGHLCIAALSEYIASATWDQLHITSCRAYLWRSCTRWMTNTRGLKGAALQGIWPCGCCSLGGKRGGYRCWNSRRDWAGHAR